MQKHHSDMPKTIELALDESKLPHEAQQQQRPRSHVARGFSEWRQLRGPLICTLRLGGK